MWKFLLMVLLGGVVFWMFTARSRKPLQPPGQAKPKPDVQVAKMLACAHCGVHLPQADTVADAAGRPYCTEAHRLAGPR